jgi:hypothetical protein
MPQIAPLCAGRIESKLLAAIYESVYTGIPRDIHTCKKNFTISFGVTKHDKMENNKKHEFCNKNNGKKPKDYYSLTLVLRFHLRYLLVLLPNENRILFVIFHISNM